MKNFRFSFLALLLLMVGRINAVLPSNSLPDDIKFTPTSTNVEGNDGETYLNAFDGIIETKWCGVSQENKLYLEFQAEDIVRVVSYLFYTGNDVNCDGQNRNPKSWTLKAKKKLSDDWTIISTVDNGNLPTEPSTMSSVYDIDQDYANKYYKYFRFDFTKDTDCFELGEIVLDAFMCIHEFDPNTYVCKYCGIIGPHEHRYDGEHGAICSICNYMKSHKHQPDKSNKCTLCGTELCSGILAQIAEEDYIPALDANSSTVWNAQGEGPQSLEVEMSFPVSIDSYTITSGEPHHCSRERNDSPTDWILYGRQEGCDQWEILDVVTDELLPTVKDVEPLPFEVADKTTKYKYFRLDLIKSETQRPYPAYSYKISEFKLNYNNLLAPDKVVVKTSDDDVQNLFDGDTSTGVNMLAHGRSFEFRKEMKISKAIAKTYYFDDKSSQRGPISVVLQGVTDKGTVTIGSFSCPGDIRQRTDYTFELNENANSFYREFILKTEETPYTDLFVYELDLQCEADSSVPDVPENLVYRTSTVGEGENKPQNIFDNDKSTIFSAEVSGINEYDEAEDCWSISWICKEPKAISAYTLIPGTVDEHTPMSWKLWCRTGAHEKWVLLSDISNPNLKAGSESPMFYAENDSYTAYKEMRLDICAAKQGNVFELAELKILTPCDKHDFSGEYSKRCQKCGYMEAHEHDENEICSLCGLPNHNFIIGYVGNGEHPENIRSIYNIKKNELKFEGTGEMAPYKDECNLWRKYKDDISSVYIGEGITSIGDASYNDSYFMDMKNLTSVSLPSTLKHIGSHAFYGCLNLQTIDLPEGLETISSSAFMEAGLTSISLPSALEIVGDSAFLGNKFTEITFPAKLQPLGLECFAENNELSKITFDGPTYISDKCFENTALNEVILQSEQPLPKPGFRPFGYSVLDSLTLRTNNRIYDWATTTSPWSEFGQIRPLFNFEITPKGEEMQYLNFDLKGSDDNVLSMTDGDVENLRAYEDIPMKQFTYNRTFTNTNWQPWVIPVDTVLTEELRSRFAFARISGGVERENGDMYVAFANVKPGEVIKANVPYVIKALTADEQTPQSFVFDNRAFVRTNEQSFSSTTLSQKFTFSTTYKSVTTEDFEAPVYVMAEGVFHPLAEGAALRPLRFYMQIEPRNDDPYKAPSGIDFYLPISTNDPTDIHTATGTEEPADGKFIQNNRIVIRLGQKKYNVLGI